MPEHLQPPVPQFSVTSPQFTECDSAVSWISSQPHFDEWNVAEQGVSQCGDIAFSGGSGSWDARYTFSGAHEGDWSLWRRLTRDATSGDFSDSTAHQEQVDSDTLNIAFELKQEFDLVGLQHQVTPTSAIPPLDSEVEGWAQIWRSIDEPEISAVELSKDTVTITFVNNSQGRGIDSTWVEDSLHQSGADWVRRGAVGEDEFTFIDTLVSPGTHTYRLKHVSEGILVGGFAPLPPRPNSGWVDTVITVAGFPDPTQFWCDDTLEPAVRCFWSVGTDTAAIQVQRNGAITDTLAAGSDSLVHTDVATDDTLTYKVRHLSTAQNTVSDWVSYGPFPVEPTAPESFGCNSDNEMIGCGWSTGEAYDSTEVQRRPEESSNWSFLAIVDPGITNYQDADVEVGETWCYQGRHRRGTTATSWAGPSCVTVQEDPGPRPGWPDGT